MRRNKCGYTASHPQKRKQIRYRIIYKSLYCICKNDASAYFINRWMFWRKVKANNSSGCRIYSFALFRKYFDSEIGWGSTFKWVKLTSQLSHCHGYVAVWIHMLYTDICGKKSSWKYGYDRFEHIRRMWIWLSFFV